MIYPNFIKENDTIGVPTPSASSIEIPRQNKTKSSKEYFEKLGYNVILSKNIFNGYRCRSANAVDRAKEINEMFKNKEIDFIICSSGGEFLVEILPYVDFNIIKDNPKFISGFSDPTGLLYPITTKYDIATIYGQNFTSFGATKLDKSYEDFLNIIKGNLITEESYPFYEEEPFERITGLEPDNLTEKVYWNTLDNKEVNVTGRIIGGCFDIIAELSGTKYDGIKEFNEKYKNDGIIWYFDNCELSMEETIRVLWKMNELIF